MTKYAAKVDPKDPQAAALGYVTDATKADKAKFPKYAAGQACGSCQLFQGKAGDPVVAEIMARRLLSPMDSLLRLTDADGKVLAWNDDTKDPAFGTPAVWIEPAARDQAEMFGYTVVESNAVVATHRHRDHIVGHEHKLRRSVGNIQCRAKERIMYAITDAIYARIAIEKHRHIRSNIHGCGTGHTMGR